MVRMIPILGPFFCHVPKCTPNFAIFSHISLFIAIRENFKDIFRASFGFRIFLRSFWLQSQVGSTIVAIARSKRNSTVSLAHAHVPRTRISGPAHHEGPRWAHNGVLGSFYIHFDQLSRITQFSSHGPLFADFLGQSDLI